MSEFRKKYTIKKYLIRAFELENLGLPYFYSVPVRVVFLAFNPARSHSQFISSWENVEYAVILFFSSRTERKQKSTLLWGCFRTLIPFPAATAISLGSRIPPSLSTSFDGSFVRPVRKALCFIEDSNLTLVQYIVLYRTSWVQSWGDIFVEVIIRQTS